jgi:hypothetical protein
MPRIYSNPEDEPKPWMLPDILIESWTRDELQAFYDAQTEWTGMDADDANDAPGTWMFCFSLPGCLPDSDWFGPYESYEAAAEAAREMCND